MLRTSFEDACFEHTSLVKWGEDNQWIQLKRMLIKAGFLLEAGSRIPAPFYFEQVPGHFKHKILKKSSKKIINLNYILTLPCKFKIFFLHLFINYLLQVVEIKFTLTRKALRDNCILLSHYITLARDVPHI